MEPKHTPTLGYETPIHLEWDDAQNNWMVRSYAGQIIARIQTSDAEIPAYIVKCVNAHEELITAALRLRNEAMHFHQTGKGEEFLLRAVHMLEQAIAKAEGE